jgi:D-xylose transport system ATP-binding protein
MGDNGPQGDQPQGLLSLRGVTKRFGAVQALDDVRLDINAGEVVALVGDNGAGKSTLVKVISGIYSPDRASVWFDGRPVTLGSPGAVAKLGIATVYQDLALCDNLDVVANLFLGHEVRSPLGQFTRAVDETRMEHRSQELLSNLAVTIPSLRTEVGTLSGGQRQQVAVARSLLGGRGADRAGAGSGQAAEGAGPGRDDDQPQPRRRVRGCRSHRGAPAGQGGRRLRH